MRQDSLDPRSDIDLDVVERYFSNTLPPADRAEFEQSLTASPARRQLVEELRTLWDSYALAGDPWNTDVMWQRVMARTGVQWPPSMVGAVATDSIGTDVPRMSVSSSVPSSSRRAAVMSRSARGGMQTRRWMSAAVTAVMVCGFGVWAWTHAHPTRTSAAAAAPGYWKMYTTPRGQRSSITLPDGTKIVLAADSRLRVRRDAATTRDVELVGEAFFDVHHDPAHPFVVHTAQGVVTELGTAFSVRAYPDDPDARVVVTSGRVRLTPIVILGTPIVDTAIALEPGHVRGTVPGGGTRNRSTTGFASAIVLVAGDVAHLTNGRYEVEHDADVQGYNAWLTGELRFVRTPLSTVVRALERWYDVKVNLADPKYAKYILTVSVRDGSVDDAMDVVTKSLELRYEKRDGAVWIVGQNSH